MNEFMRSSDAFTWSMESDPRLRSTVVTVLLLDASPDWAEVRDRVERLTYELPMMRQRVVNSPLSAAKRRPRSNLAAHSSSCASDSATNSISFSA